MNSPSTSPYKSRFFSLVSENSRKFLDTCGWTWRHVKYAVGTATQIVLYPVYLMAQTARLAGRQLQTTVKQQIPQIKQSVNQEAQTPYTADIPIQHILQTATATPLPEQTDPETVQGIATQLETGNLVLVTNDNEILDILTQQQQHTLRQRMIGEIANYLLYRNQLVPYAKPFNAELKPLANQANLLLPIRLFWQALAWVQTSPVAVKINLFGEATFNLDFPPQPQQLTGINFSLEQLPFFNQMDGAIAQIEQHPLAAVSKIPSTLIQQSQTFQKAMMEVWQESNASLEKTGDRTLNPNTDAYFHRLQLIIFAAIDYFFSEHNSSLNPDPTTHPDSEPLAWQSPATPLELKTASPTPSQSKIYPSLEDPWLEANLAKSSPVVSSSQTFTETSPNKALPAGKKTIKNKVFTRLKAYFTPLTTALESELNPPIFPEKTPSFPPTNTPVQRFNPQPIQGLTNEQKSAYKPAQTAFVSPTVKSESTIPTVSLKRATATAAQTSSTASGIEAKPEWLEAQATPTGYIKHPLERLLEWLDHLMLGVEEAAIRFWQWLVRKNK